MKKADNIKFDSNEGRFYGKVYKKQQEADYFGRRIFLQRVANQDLYETLGPKRFTSGMLNVLEYFGLLLPVAKIKVPFNIAGGHSSFVPGEKTTSPESWVVWSQDNKKWMFAVNVRIKDSEPQYKETVSGNIFYPKDIDYWRAFRGIYPARLKRLQNELRTVFEEYNQNPFDMPITLLRHGNEDLDGHGIVPIYNAQDVNKCLNTLGFLTRTLPLPYSILAYSESQKTIRGNKINTPLKFKELLWKSVITGFKDDLRSTQKSFPMPPDIILTKNFYRNHYITCFVLSLKDKSSSIVKACGEAAKKAAIYNTSGEEPLDAETIRRTIYYPTIKNPLFHNNCI